MTTSSRSSDSRVPETKTGIPHEPALRYGFPVEPTAPKTGPGIPPHIETYYGRPVLKRSPFDWKVSTYIFIAGLAGAAQIIATVADFLDAKRAARMIRRGRAIALVAPAIGSVLLVLDLHTPQRFYNMLRIFRRTSPMSIGTYVLTAFSVFSGLTALAQRLGAKRVARVAQIPAAIAGAGMTTYTAALLAATSTPLWAAAPRLLGTRFASSAMASGAAALSLCEQHGDDPATGRVLDAVALTATTVEFAAALASDRVYREEGVAGPLEEAPWRAVHRVGALAVGAAVPMACYSASLVLRQNSRRLSLLASLAVLAGGMMMRAAILRAGNRSAQRPEDYFRFTRPRQQVTE